MSLAPVKSSAMTPRYMDSAGFACSCSSAGPPDALLRLSIPSRLRVHVGAQIHRRWREQALLHELQIGCNARLERHVSQHVLRQINARRDLDHLKRAAHRLKNGPLG